LRKEKRQRKRERKEECANLLDLPFVPLIRPRHIIRQRLRAGEVVIAARGRYDVAVAGNLTGKAGDGAGD